MSIRTSILLAKNGGRSVYHTRTAPLDRRQPGGGGNVTHAWEHADDEATRAACDACRIGKLPEDVR